SRGLNITVLEDKSIDFVHAEIFIFSNSKPDNPVIPYLTMFNIFNRELNVAGSGLTGLLRKLGNDFHVEQTVDYLHLKVNFLSDKAPLFARLLKALYRYKPFSDIKVNPESHIYTKRIRDTEKKFKKSKEKYWRIFTKNEHWKRDIAFQIGYAKLFPGSSLGNILFSTEMIKQATLDDVRKYYRRMYRFPNSIVILKGNLRPHMAFGIIERELAGFKMQVPEVPVDRKLRIEKKRKIVVFDNAHVGSPVLYWFNSIPSSVHKDYMPSILLNIILYGIPNGKIFLNARGSGIKQLSINSVVNIHRGVSVICNIVELRYKHLERFITLADREQRTLSIKKVQRADYVRASTYLNGSWDAGTRFVDSDFNMEAFSIFFPPAKGLSIGNPSTKYTLDDISRLVKVEPGGIIVIVGSAAEVLARMPRLRPSVTVISFD
ncbi:MAG: insulinase family protein, partial [bacterium]|nr:insulinase family protein [bacterium]